VHEFYPLHPDDKDVFLCQLLDMERPQSAVIYAASRERVSEIIEHLRHRGINAGEYREQTGLGGFRPSNRPLRDSQPKYFVIGFTPGEKLKLPSVSHVIHADLAASVEEYQRRVDACSPWASGIRSMSLIETGRLPDFEQWRGSFASAFEERRPRLFSPRHGHQPSMIEDGPRGGHVVSERLKQPAARCEVLDHLGLPPTERTLGSRFASTRRGKRKWEPRTRTPDY
jgi:hypothetical protein